VIKKRFYHGISNYGISQNWIAYISGKLVWSHFAAIVRPSDLLKNAEGLCSQQTIVFLDILKNKGIKFRTVGLGYDEGPGHFLSEVYYNGAWHMYDVTMEPNWSAITNQHKSLEYYLNNKDTLLKTYEGKLHKDGFDKILKRVVYGKVEKMPGQNMALFHVFTHFLTYAFPLFFLWMIIRTIRKMKKGEALGSDS
jgi:hypothetical protein